VVHLQYKYKKIPSNRLNFTPERFSESREKNKIHVQVHPVGHYFLAHFLTLTSGTLKYIEELQNVDFDLNHGFTSTLIGSSVHAAQFGALAYKNLCSKACLNIVNAVLAEWFRTVTYCLLVCYKCFNAE
jgi:hypothetical protein